MIATVAPTIAELPALERDLDPDEVDRRIGHIALAASESDAALAFYLYEVEVRLLFIGFGCRTTASYAEERHGIPPDRTWRLLRAARVCARSPILRSAFDRGAIPLYKMDALKEVVGLGEDEAWAALASDRTINKRLLRGLVKRRLGEEPDDVRIWLRVELTPMQYRAVQAGLETARRVGGAEISDAEGLEAMAVDYTNALHDESQLDPALVRLDPAIPRRVDGSFDPEAKIGALPHRGDPDTTWRSPTPIGDAPMCDERDDRERDAAFRGYHRWRAGWLCETGCGARAELDVDHSESRARAPGRRWDLTNGALLCRGCHELKTVGLIRIARLPDGRLEVQRPDRWKRPPGRRA